MLVPEELLLRMFNSSGHRAVMFGAIISGAGINKTIVSAISIGYKWAVHAHKGLIFTRFGILSSHF